MKRVACCIAALVCLVLSGCTINAHLFLVQGPQASPDSPAGYSAKFVGSNSSGTFSGTLANGEAFSGQWTPVPTGPANQASATDSSASPNIAAVWDTVYGQGFYVAHILGERDHIRSTMTGNQGTTLTVEVSWADANPGPQAANKVKGVAEDSHGNIYKITF